MPIDISFGTGNDQSNYTTKTFADQNYINVEGDKMQGTLNLANNKLTNVAKPVGDKDAATKSYVDDASFLPLTGGTLEGVLNMNSNKISGVSNPTTGSDVVNKTYLDTQVRGVRTQMEVVINRLIGQVVVLKFNLKLLLPGVINKHKLDESNENGFFIVSTRFKRPDGIWVHGSIPHTSIRITNNIFYVNKFLTLDFPNRHLTGECEILLLRGLTETIDITAKSTPSTGTPSWLKAAISEAKHS